MILPVEACRPETPFSHREKPEWVGRNKKDTTSTNKLAQKSSFVLLDSELHSYSQRYLGDHGSFVGLSLRRFLAKKVFLAWWP